MSQYFDLKKLRRKSKQPEAQEATHEDVLKATIPSAPVATLANPSDEPVTSPMLDEEDEKFLQRLAAIAQEPEGTPPPLPNRPVVVTDNGERKVGKDAQEALMDGANKIPLPTSPPEMTMKDGEKGKGKADADGTKKNFMSYFNLAQTKFKRSGEASKDKEGKGKGKGKQVEINDKDRTMAADALLAAAASAKSEEAKENEELANVLDQLNLSAVNNRVFSFSKESEELLNKFKLVLKDIVNGVPTAYNDLEKLLTDSESQLKKMYGSLPPFLQNLVKSLPAKMTTTLGPELLAAGAEKPGFDAKQKFAAAGVGATQKRKRATIPSLKSLISAEGAVATMLRSILSFLKLRFPVLLTGTNVVLSLAVFLLLVVFWYCHKRGRETRLEKEALDASGTDPALASSASSFTDNDGDSLLDEKMKGESSKQASEKPEPPLIISDGKEDNEAKAVPESSSATVDDLPSVSHLPEPKGVSSETNATTPTPDREEPLRVPGSN